VQMREKARQRPPSSVFLVNSASPPRSWIQVGQQPLIHGAIRGVGFQQDFAYFEFRCRRALNRKLSMLSGRSPRSAYGVLTAHRPAP
jgi:hypothetical protein